jgi:hypothetical protein
VRNFAALWYDERRTGLGDEFIAPESYPAWPATRAVDPLIRKATVQRFPYLIAFEQREQHLLILAVPHGKRRPLYWLTRAHL